MSMSAMYGVLEDSLARAERHLDNIDAGLDSVHAQKERADEVVREAAAGGSARAEGRCFADTLFCANPSRPVTVADYMALEAMEHQARARRTPSAPSGKGDAALLRTWDRMWRRQGENQP
jgi:hypothetical protein